MYLEVRRAEKSQDTGEEREGKTCSIRSRPKYKGRDRDRGQCRDRKSPGRV